MEWGDFGITPVSADHPLTRRLHVGFGVEDRQAVDAWWQRMTEAGYTSDGEPGPRPEYTETYYGGFVLDPDGNSIEAVHHYRSRTGEIDHVWLRTTDIAAGRDFYETIAAAVGIELVREQPDLVRYSDGAGSFTFILGERTDRARPPGIRRPRPPGSRSLSPARDRGRPRRQRPARRAPALPPRLLRSVRARPAREQRRSRLPRPHALTVGAPGPVGQARSRPVWWQPLASARCRKDTAEGAVRFGSSGDQPSRCLDDCGSAALHRPCVQPAARISFRRRDGPRSRDRVDEREELGRGDIRPRPGRPSARGGSLAS